MKTNVTASSIKRMKYLDLQKLCAKKGIEFQGQSREKLAELLISKLASLEGDLPEAEIVRDDKQTVSNNSDLPVAKDKKLDKKEKLSAKAEAKKKSVPAKKEKVASTKKAETKSSKIIALHLKGKKVSEISIALKAHPSFCYTVIKKHKESK